MSNEFDFPRKPDAILESTLESRLCQRCSVLSFDDMAHDGFGIQNDDGKWLLGFRQVLRREDEPIKFYKEIQLEFELSDQLPDLPSLRASAEAGCEFCGALRDAILTLRLDFLSKVTFDLRYLWSTLIEGLAGLKFLVVHLNIESEDNEDNDHQDNILFNVDCESGDCMTWLQTVQSPYKETLCRQNVDWMKKHLKVCEASHYAGPASTFQPSRLLDLGSDLDNGDFRLINTADGEATNPLQYAALSYCWGPEQDAKQQLKTLSSNFRKHRSSIAFASATRVVQDAVTAARALSIRYLWIDALCIIQDNSDDWNRESGQMGSIYANAYVTFCTSTSASCMEGFLTRPPAINIKFGSRLRPDIQGIYSLRHQRSKNNHAFANIQSISMHLDTNDLIVAGTWSQRAWTLQEQHLSRRRIYFGCSRVYLHCSEDQLREPLDYCPDYEDKNYNSFRDQVLRYNKERNIQLLHHDWEELISIYVNRLVTYKTDTFPAISGLARVMAAELGDTYLAGLWKNDLPRGLLWTSSQKVDNWDALLHRLTLPSANQYISPSWSWASMGRAYEPPSFTTDATISGHFAIDEEDDVETGFRSECSIVAAWCTPISADLNEYGQIIHGELHVEGKLKKCAATWVQDPRAEYYHNCWTAVGDDHTAACTTDFAVSAEAKEIQLDNVSMLLLSSSCGYHTEWPRRRHYEHASSLLEDSETDSIRLTYLKMSQRPDSTSREDDEDEDEDEDPESDAYETSDDSSSQSSGSTFNNFTRQQRAKQRNAWGLLVHPVAGTDQFVRVGLFRVSFEQGGLRCFEEQPVALVKLI